MADQESITLDLDPRSVLAAVKQANQAVEGWEKQTVGSGDRMQKALERMSEMLLKINDRSRSSMERLTQSIEKQASAYGKIGVERLIAERDRLIKKLGDEQGMIDRVTAAYAKMIDVENGKSGGSLQTLGRNIESFIRDPLNGSKEAAAGLAEKLGTTGTVIGVGTGVLAAFAVAGWEAAKSLGEYGSQIENTATRMGLTTREVGQFSFAAKVAGQDISVFEGGMRKLSQGLADGGQEGRKVREAFRELGIESANVDGSARPMANVFLQISERLRAIEDPARRNAEAIKLFGRSGIEALPAILSLSENLQRAKELGLGASEEEVRRWERYHKTITEADTAWDKLVRKIKEPIAATVVFFYRWAASDNKGGTFDLSPPAGVKAPDMHGYGFQDLPLIGDLLANRGLYAPGAAAIPGLQSQYLRQGLAQSAATRALRGQLDTGLEGAKAGLEDLKTAYADARNKAQQLASNAMVLPDAARKAWDEVERTRKAYQGQSDLVKELEKDESRRVSLLEKARDLVRTGHTFYQIGTGALATITTDEQMWQANQPTRGVPTLRRRGEADPTLDVAAVQTQERALSGLQPGLQVIPAEGMVFVAGPPPVDVGAQEQMAAYAKGQLGLIETQRQARLSQIATQGSLASRLAEMDRENQIQTARTVGGIREDTLRRELEITGDIVKYRQESVQNELEMRLKIAEEEKHQLDSLKQESAGLLHTLFTRPSDFGKQLSSTIRDAALKPVEEGIGGMIAAGIRPLIYGANGEGGIAGVFHGIFGGKQQDPLKLAMDMNTDAEANNTAALAALTLAFLRFGALPRMAEGGVTRGPSLAGEAGPELVIPLANLRNMGLGSGARIVGSYGPETDLGLQKATGTLMDVALPAGLAALGGPGAVSVGETLWSLLLGGVSAVTPARNDGVSMGMIPIGPPGARAGYTKVRYGQNAFDLTEDQLRAAARKGGLRSQETWAKRRASQDPEIEPITGRYIGPPVDVKETTHEASLKIDQVAPWLRNAQWGGGQERLLYGGKMMTDMAIAGALGTDTEAVYFWLKKHFPTSDWRTVDLANAFPRFWPNEPPAINTFVPANAGAGKGAAVLVGGRWVSKEQASEILGKPWANIAVWFKTHRPGVELTTIDLANEYHPRAYTKNLPSHDSGGTIASTGLALVHQGEAVIPQADTLKHSIDNLTAAMHRSVDIQSLFTSMLMPLFFAGGGTMAAGAIGGGAAAGTAPTAAGGGTAAIDVSSLPTSHPAFNPIGALAPTLFRGSTASSTAASRFFNANRSIFTRQGLQAFVSGLKNLPTNLRTSFWNQAAWDATDSNFWGAISAVGTSPAVKAGMGSLGGIGVSYGLSAPPSATTDLSLIGGGAAMGAATAGPIGAVFGGAAGAATAGFKRGGLLGDIEMGFSPVLMAARAISGYEDPVVHTKTMVKQLYTIDIDTATAQQIMQIAKQKYNNHISLAVRDPEVRKMLMLYSQATGQHMPPSAATPQSASIAEVGGRLFQQSSYVNGMPYAFQSNLPVEGGYATGTYPSPGPMMLQLNVSGQGAAQFVAGQVVTPEFVQSQWSSAAAASNGRVLNSAMMQQPGLVVA